MIFMPSDETVSMLRILDRYLLKEVIYGWLAVTIILWYVTSRMPLPVIFRVNLSSSCLA
jgi:hypothetical protein